MKKLLFKLSFILLIIFGFSGCYTIIWSPDSEFPNQDNSDNSTIYYGDPYYGPYYDYYDIPWWYDFAPAPTVTRPTRENNPEIGRLRDSGGDRGESPRIPDVQPPSRNGDTTSNNTNTGSSNSSGNSSTETERSSSSSNTGSTGDRGSSSGSGSVRNNNGDRSSGGRR